MTLIPVTAQLDIGPDTRSILVLLKELIASKGAGEATRAAGEAIGIFLGVCANTNGYSEKPAEVFSQAMRLGTEKFCEAVTESVIEMRGGRN